MNKEFEKIIEKLEEYKYENLVEHDYEQSQHCKDIGDCEMRDCVLCVFDKAIEIVKQEAEQYINGWISVKETLPEKAGSYLVIGKSGGAFVTRWYKPSEFHPNGHFGGNCSDYIRYWMPRPEQPQPYQPKGE